MSVVIYLIYLCPCNCPSRPDELLHICPDMSRFELSDYYAKGEELGLIDFGGHLQKFGFIAVNSALYHVQSS